MENYTQLCVWPGTTLGDNTPEELEGFFLNEMNTRVKYKCEVKTNPNLNESGKAIPDTGDRNDLFFYVHTEDIAKFAIPRLKMGIRWWEDVVGYNDNRHMYMETFINDNKLTW